MPSLRLPVFDEKRGEFASLRNTNVLIYWPHGLGDWVHLGAILPLLEPSNRYSITRFGDDFVSVLDGNQHVRAIHLGRNEISDGSAQGARHLGLDFKRIDGGVANVRVPQPLHSAMIAADIQAVLYTDYPDNHGGAPFPFHTKARKLLRNLVAPQRLAQFDLAVPLQSTIDFRVGPALQRAVDDRLRAIVEPHQRLCVVVPSGHTATRKSWDPYEVERFASGLRSRDARWRFFYPERDYGALFGDLGRPFAQVFKGILARAALVAGVPAGPLHMALARGDVPVVGIWQVHHPDWYDEPSPRAVHLIGRGVRQATFWRAFARRVPTVKPQALEHRVRLVDTRHIPAEAALDATTAVL